MPARLFRVALAVLGLVALVFGLHGVVTGTGGVTGGGPASASTDSEMRFFAAWYAAAGLLLLRSVWHRGIRGPVVRTCCAALLLAAGGRLLSIAEHGRPHDLYVALLVVELVIPAVLLPWHALLARRDRR